MVNGDTVTVLNAFFGDKQWRIVDLTGTALDRTVDDELLGANTAKIAGGKLAVIN